MRLSSKMAFQHLGNHPMQLEPHEDLLLKYHKLQQEADHLRKLLAQEEVHSRSLHKQITELRKELHQNQRQLQDERYFRKKRISREIDLRHPKDLRRGDRSESHNFRWRDTYRDLPSVPAPNTRPFYRRYSRRGPPDTGWRHEHIRSNHIWNLSRPRR